MSFLFYVTKVFEFKLSESRQHDDSEYRLFLRIEGSGLVVDVDEEGCNIHSYQYSAAPTTCQSGPTTEVSANLWMNLICTVRENRQSLLLRNRPTNPTIRCQCDDIP